jgi:hypothetical protein
VFCIVVSKWFAWWIWSDASMVCVVKHKWFTSGWHNVSITHMCPWYKPYDQYNFFVVFRQNCHEAKWMEHHAHWRDQNHPRGQRNDMLPLHLQHHMPTFTMWLEAWVKHLVVAHATIIEELVQLSCPLSWITYTYSSMWAYRNHFQVDPKTTRPTHLTYDARVACIF